MRTVSYNLTLSRQPRVAETASHSIGLRKFVGGSTCPGYTDAKMTGNNNLLARRGPRRHGLKTEITNRKKHSYVCCQTQIDSFGLIMIRKCFIIIITAAAGNANNRLTLV